MLPLISVIVPVYNTEKYLKECVESICKQTYTNLECILIDDGSLDKSGELCDKLARTDKRIQVIHKKNGGLSSARNCGIDLSEGEYICFIDSDDWIHEKYLEELYNALIDNEADLALCSMKWVYPFNYNNKKMQFAPLVDKVCVKGQILKELINENDVYYIVACNKLYKKSLWDGIRYPISYIHEDEAVAHRILNKCDITVSISDELYYYRQIDGSIMNSGKNVKHMDKYVAWADRITFLANQLEKEDLYKMCYKFWYNFMDDYYYFFGKENTKKYTNRMKHAMCKVCLIMLNCKLFTLKDMVGVLVFLVNSRLYKKYIMSR